MIIIIIIITSSSSSCSSSSSSSSAFINQLINYDAILWINMPAVNS